ncbi:MAG TPA: DUF402 domain-containing protein [Nocardioides sp.]
MQLGTPVRVAMTKWGDRPHWAYSARYLGRDEHGDWVGVTAGTLMSRPGAELIAPLPQVCLAPTLTAAEASGWFATFHTRSAPYAGAGAGAGKEPVFPVEVYVDIATQPVWDGTTIRAIDLDLDVVRGFSGRVWIDDEDEFAEHRIAFDYPAATVDLALANCEAVHRAVRDHAAPYDESTPARWAEVLATLV